MRATSSVPSRKRRKKLIARAKGFSQSVQIYRHAKENLLKAGQHAYRGRKERKRTFRTLWIIRLAAAARENGLNYSQLMAKLKQANILLNRKILSELAISDNETFKKIIQGLHK